MTFTDADSSGVFIKSVHVTDLRAAITEAMNVALMPIRSFDAITTGTSAVHASDFSQIADTMR